MSSNVENLPDLGLSSCGILLVEVMRPGTSRKRLKSFPRT